MTASSAGTTAAHDPSHRPPPTPAEVLDLLRSDPHRPWHGRDIAQILNVTNINSLCTRMSQWAHKGLLRKTGRATYWVCPRRLLIRDDSCPLQVRTSVSMRSGTAGPAVRRVPGVSGSYLLNTVDGAVTCVPVAEARGMAHTPLTDVLG
jgi:hypothetical protein